MKAVQRALRTAFTLLMFLCLVSKASAHSAPEEARSFYGGLAHTTDAFNLELVVEAHKLQLFVRDRHNWPLDIRGFGATALLWGKDGSVEIDLSPGKRSALIGERAVFVLDLERIVVTLRAPGREPVTAWFKAEQS